MRHAPNSPDTVISLCRAIADMLYVLFTIRSTPNRNVCEAFYESLTLVIIGASVFGVVFVTRPAPSLRVSFFRLLCSLQLLPAKVSWLIASYLGLVVHPVA